MIGINVGRLFNTTPGNVAAVSGSPALLFDGSQNYVDLGNMGTLGADVSAGFYLSMDFKSTDAGTNVSPFGTLTAGNINTIRFLYNQGGVAGKMQVSFYDSTSKKIVGTFTNTAISNGVKHTLTVTITPSTNTIVATVDGTGQTISYSNQETPNTFANFANHVALGCLNNNGSFQNNMICTIDNVKIGVASNNLYGNYAINEGTGTTIADTSGKSNTGTLTGTPPPSWVTM